MPPRDSRVAVLIPARYGSTRFPGKPLVPLCGTPMIQHVYEAAASMDGDVEVRVVTDDERIAEAVRAFGGLVSIVDRPCRTGTDRVAAAAESMDVDVVVNLQADEVPLHPDLLSDLVVPFLRSNAVLGTLKRRIHDPTAVQDSSLVKVVTDRDGRALYFSRSPIPHVRDPEEGTPCHYDGHLGIYIFRMETLRTFAALPTGELEAHEKLEQLRALEHGIPIHVWRTRHPSLRIDRPEDVTEASMQLHQYRQAPTHSSIGTVS